MAKRKKKKRRDGGKKADAKRAKPTVAKPEPARSELSKPEPAKPEPTEPTEPAPVKPEPEREQRQPSKPETRAEPTGLTARRVLGVAALSLTVAAVVSGLALLFPYNSAAPHDAMKEMLVAAPLGAFWQSLHRLGASGLLLCLGGYLVACLLARGPLKRSPFYVSVALLIIAVGMSCSGEGLGGDHIARGKMEATTSLGANLPLVGSLQKVLRAGDAVAPETTKRFFFLHVMPLPLPLLGLALLIFRLRMSAAESATEPQEQRGSSRQQDLTIALATLAAVTLLAAFWPVELGSAVARAEPAKAPWYLVGWQEMDSYSPAIALLFMAVLLVGLLIVPRASHDATRAGRWLAAGAAVAAGVIAGAAVWWWRDPSYGAPAVLNPATIVLLAVAVCGAIAWRLTASTAAGLRAGIAAMVAALVVFTTVGALLRGPSWTLGWHPEPKLVVNSAAQTAEKAAATAGSHHSEQEARPR